MERNADPIGIDARVGRRKSKTVREATIPLWPKPSRNVFSRIPRVSWIVRTDEFNIGTREYARPAAKNIPGHGMLFPAWNRNQGNLLRFILVCLLLSLFIILKRVWFFFIFYFPTISLSFSIEFLRIFFHRTVWTAWSVFFGRFISCHPLTFFCFSALFITLRRLLQFSYISLLFLLRRCTLCLCSPLYSLRTFRSSFRLLFSNFHFLETHTPHQLSSAK